MTPRKRTRLGVIHVTATRPGYRGGVEGIRRQHMRPIAERGLGASDIGYHWLIDVDGTRLRGRDERLIGAHVRGYNSESVGIALIGGVDAEGRADASTITREQWAALDLLCRDLAERYPQIQFCGHRDLSPDRDGDGVVERGEWLKECPTFDVIPWAASHGLPVARIRGEWAKRDPRRPTAPDERTAYLQRLLLKAGYDFGVVDGLVGARTREAIRGFQRDRDLPQTGEFDRPTVAELRRRVEGRDPAPAEARPGWFDGIAGPHWLLSSLASAMTWFADLDRLTQVSLILAIAGGSVLVLREVRARAEVAAKLRAGDEMAEPDADWLDYVIAWTRAQVGAAGRGLIGVGASAS